MRLAPAARARQPARRAGRGLLGGEESERLPAVGPSFRDATRVAGANSAIWTDIYMSNRDALIDASTSSRAPGEVRAMLAGDAGRDAWNDARAARDALLGAA